jgi:uroporphyrinogen decarboxylase
LFKYPEASHNLLQRLTTVCIDYLVAQAEAGAQLLKVFDSWAGELSQDQFQEFILPYVKQIATTVQERLAAADRQVPPMILFAKGAHYAVGCIAQETTYNVIALDWTMDAAEARATVDRVTQRPVALQGNLDPCALYGSDEGIRCGVRKVLQQFGTQGHIFNLGHGMHPEHNPDAVRVLVDAVHSISEELLAAKQQQQQ